MNQQARLCAQDIVNGYGEDRLADVLYLYGELKNSRALARAIVKARIGAPLRTTGELAEAVRPVVGAQREKKDLAKVFQALRIEVNGEMKALEQMLLAAIRILKPGGRLSVLTYHSLEDRMVKNIMRTGNIRGEMIQDLYGRSLAPLRPVGKMVVPDEEEQARNPRSRSAKLRVAEKI